MIESHIIGLSRLGFKRDIKITLEKCFTSNKNEFHDLKDYLIEIKKKILYKNWLIKILNQITYINVGDFSLYDHILDNIFNIYAIPKRFGDELSLKNYFNCARGNEVSQPMEMKKWFNTNYHYIVPEYDIKTKFQYNKNCFLKKDLNFASIFKNKIKLIIIGPITLLKLGKIKDNILKNKLFLIPKLVENILKMIIDLCKINNNIKIIQIEEPVSILNLSKIWLENIKSVYTLICSYFKNILFTTYFDEINKNLLNYLKDIKFYAIHIDLFNNGQENNFVKINLKSKYISLGLVNGRDIWKNDLEKSYYTINKFNNKKIIISTSCSLIHSPIDISLEDKNIKKIKNWISFGVQKIEEINIINNLYKDLKLKSFINKKFIKNIFFIKNKKKSKLIFFKKVQNKLRKICSQDFNFKNNININNDVYKSYFKKNFLTTNIGSFPQTKKIRKIRSDFKNNLIEKSFYEKLIKREIIYILKKQLDYKIDVLVHGEPERNDMVEYFAEIINGYSITKYGWVQSYGSRYVKPPIIYGDLFLKSYMTVNWIKFSQKFIKQPLKGMLTGPLTMIKWSFIRDDQPFYITAIQVAVILNKEILKLERLGIKIIQIDEPSIREFLPIKKNKYNKYFNWSSKSFLLIYKNLKSTTQIHTHVCYSDFKNIIDLIDNLNVDVISIETARSNFDIIHSLKKYKKGIGLGVYDIHTNRKMSIDAAMYIIKIILSNIKKNRVWINPDCGLKTRKWKDIDKSLMNMVAATQFLN
ncbi:5-methyltetrahydropteroyltriglutamate-- homocysteine methyltransferase [Candidatus Nasuia deltocephalinicola]|uniref:5-methyltetrahydropteroyltriglutamate--homocysteine S-methyltransferase n=1 Tax=Candidatus Nasuia deltocephalincola TaxID=1160784 RepID=A0A0S2UPI5_9PROT|nr:5-methyltetrahydropteroyltriglutamate-- homocysteine methyltransferase [Candidatus Nasuia deltocephalinicola]